MLKKPVEVLKVLPAYQKISKARKMEVLKLFHNWITKEFKNLSAKRK